MSSSALKTTITSDRQRYVDEAIMVKPKPTSQIEQRLAKAFGHKLAQPIITHHERVRLRWVTPDGKGGVKERTK